VLNTEENTDKFQTAKKIAEFQAPKTAVRLGLLSARIAYTRCRRACGEASLSLGEWPEASENSFLTQGR
jgi:hypothetical protein